MCSVDQKPVFRELTGDDPEPEVTEIDSLCVNCFASGTTRLLLTKIPYYKNVIIMSFSCETCGFENNEIQPGGAFAELGVSNISLENLESMCSRVNIVVIPFLCEECGRRNCDCEVWTLDCAKLGVRWKLEVKSHTDLNRQVVKSDYTSVRIAELDFEIPAQSQKGEVTTVEGIISRAIAGLTQDQDARREQHPDSAAQIDAFVERLQSLKSLERPWTLELEDASGNTFVENPEAPRRDPNCERTDFKRTKEQNHGLGIFMHDEVSDEAPRPSGEASSLLSRAGPDECSFERLQADEVLQFRTNCPECNAPADTNMKLTMIPHFKEVVIMATMCDACGHRTNEVKSGGGVEDKGVRFEVRVRGKEDFSRDILKSETCSMEIPELELEVGGRALGGRFSTAEGLLRATRDQLADAPGAAGDAPSLAGDSLERFIDKLNEVLEGSRAVTIVLDDPAGNSYCQSLNDDDPDRPDDGLKITRYERSFEQNEELGLNDMKTENY